MKRFKQFLKEFENIGRSDTGFPSNKAIHDAEQFQKGAGGVNSNRVLRPFYGSNIAPKDLKKHVTKKLSNDKSHKSYTVHHVSNKTEYGTLSTAALLHHKKDGFVGTLYGHKTREGFNISSSHINKDHRGKGLGVALYENAVKHHGAVISDEQLSTSSQRVYSHFAKKGKVSIYNAGSYELPNPHGQKVGVDQEGKMRSKSIGSRQLYNTLDFKLKIHKNKLKK